MSPATSRVRVEVRPTGALQVNTYLVTCVSTAEAVVIDPGGEPRALAAWIASMGARVGLILHTHGHSDHVGGSEALSSLLGVRCAAHGADIDHFRLDPSGKGWQRLTHGSQVAFGFAGLEVLHTPGHTPGGVCYYGGGQLFTGDTLFVGAVGRTDLPGASLPQLLSSLQNRLLTLPADTVVWPGHDYGDTPTSTLDRERQENPFLTDLS